VGWPVASGRVGEAERVKMIHEVPPSPSAAALPSNPPRGPCDGAAASASPVLWQTPPRICARENLSGDWLAA
jgi:hypothetical protein